MNFHSPKHKIGLGDHSSLFIRHLRLQYFRDAQLRVALTFLATVLLSTFRSHRTLFPALLFFFFYEGEKLSLVLKTHRTSRQQKREDKDEAKEESYVTALFT